MNVTASSTPQDIFLRHAHAAACVAGHIFPDYAACEAALESSWGHSQLAREANNLFGQKHSSTGSKSSPLLMPTQEFLRGRWVTVMAEWARFSDQAACFRARMTLLDRLARRYPAYRRALSAPNGEVFVEEVSRAWSTDPERATKVLAIHRQHCASFLPPASLAAHLSASPAASA